MQLSYKKIKLHTNVHQSPTGHPNQIHKVNERQPLQVVSQSLQIFHKIYRNLSRRGHYTAKRRQLKTIGAFFYNLTYFYYSKEPGSSAAIPDRSGNPFLRGSAEKIATDSGKKLKKK